MIDWIDESTAWTTDTEGLRTIDILKKKERGLWSIREKYTTFYVQQKHASISLNEQTGNIIEILGRHLRNFTFYI